MLAASFWSLFKSKVHSCISPVNMLFKISVVNRTVQCYDSVSLLAPCICYQLMVWPVFCPPLAFHIFDISFKTIPQIGLKLYVRHRGNMENLNC